MGVPADTFVFVFLEIVLVPGLIVPEPLTDIAPLIEALPALIGTYAVVAFAAPTVVVAAVAE